MKRRILVPLAILSVAVAVSALTSSDASAATRVSSDSVCPSSDAISMRLLGLLAAGGPESASARVHVDAQAMHIELATPGESNQERTIPLTGSCDERAEMAALIIASWLDAMPAANLKAPGIPPRERRDVVKTGGGHDPDDPDWEPTRTSGRMLAGAGAFASADSDGGDGGLLLSAAMPELVEDFGLRFETSLGWRRQMTVGQGVASYWRPTFSLAASAEIFRKRWPLRVLVGPALGVLSVSGSGYDRNLHDTTVTWGVDFGLQLARAWRRNEAWLTLGAMAWPQGRKIRSDTPLGTVEVALPDWEARLCVGLSWGVRD